MNRFYEKDISELLDRIYDRIDLEAELKAVVNDKAKTCQLKILEAFLSNAQSFVDDMHPEVCIRCGTLRIPEYAKGKEEWCRKAPTELEHFLSSRKLSPAIASIREDLVQLGDLLLRSAEALHAARGYIYLGTYTFLIMAALARIDFMVALVPAEKKL